MMKRFFCAVASAVLLAAVASCGGNLKPLTAENFTVNPSPLVEQGGKVEATVSVSYPVKYFNKKAVLTITPVMTYNGGEVAGQPVIFQGEKVQGNDQTVSYKLGGNAQFRVSFDYIPAMLQSQLCLDFKVETGKKVYTLPRLAIADGVIATESLASAAYATPAYGYDNFVKDTFDKYIATMIYQYQSTTLRSSESGKPEVTALGDAIAATKGDDRRELTAIDMVSTASPEGSYKLNERLAAGREKSSEQYLQRMMKKAKVEGKITPEQIAEDWDGFKTLVEASNIPDKQLILSVLSRISDPDQREQEIKNLSAAYQELAEQILPKLRYSKVTATVKNIGHTDEEILALVKSDAKSLTVEELLHAATIVGTPAEKAQIFALTSQLYPSDLRAKNNQACLDYISGNYDAAEKAWNEILKADKANAQANMNLGLIALNRDDLQTAQVYISNGSAAKEYSEAMGTLQTRLGQYDKACGLFSGISTNNVAVAQLCAGRIDDARKTLNAVDKKDGLTYYLQAIVAARSNDAAGVSTNLKKAVELDSTLRAKAQSDLEFAKYQDAVKAL